MSTALNARRTEPTRRLTDQAKPHKYVHSSQQDLRRTFEIHRRLLARQQAQHQRQENP